MLWFPSPFRILIISKYNLMEKEQIKTEVLHIFESGANETRIIELIEKIVKLESLKLKLVAENMYYKGYYDSDAGEKRDFDKQFDNTINKF